MRKTLVALAAAGLFSAGTSHALFLNFETLPAGLTPTANPTQGGLLDNASELNDEFPPLRITSGGLTSDPADVFPSVSGLLNLTGTAFGPAHSGTNVVAGLEGGSGGGGEARQKPPGPVYGVYRIVDLWKWRMRSMNRISLPPVLCP